MPSEAILHRKPRPPTTPIHTRPHIPITLQPAQPHHRITTPLPLLGYLHLLVSCPTSPTIQVRCFN